MPRKGCSAVRVVGLAFFVCFVGVLKSLQWLPVSKTQVSIVRQDQEIIEPTAMLLRARIANTERESGEAVRFYWGYS